jgi:predicted acetyltransferase
MSLEIRPVPGERHADFLTPICVAFGLPLPPTPERIERLRAVPELDVLLGAFDGDALVGSAGSFTFDMTVPGGVAVETAGLTLVAVLPTHRRGGILRDLMRRHLGDAHRRGQAVAGLFASEGSIYGRFGYGMASLSGEIDLVRERTTFAPAIAPAGRVRLVSEAEATAIFPGIWERVRLSRPGMLSRSESWWRVRRAADPDWIRAGRPSLQRALLEIDGRPAAYALYRFTGTFGAHSRDIPLEVIEAMGDSPEATRSMWRWIFDIDMVSSFTALHLPVDHPLLFLLAEPRRLRMRLGDGLWVRLVDVGAALSRRRYGEGGPLVIEVEDTFCPWNQGRYRLDGEAVERTFAEPDLSLDVATLATAYLGGFSFTQLALAGRVMERTPGALRRGDALFRADRAPWCPEQF